MAIVVLRLTLTPATVLLASWVQRRLGPALGGRVVGLPLTTGPFLLLLCLGPGTGAAARAADGVVAGQLSVIGFCLGYGHLASRGRPWQVLLAALAAAAAGVAVSTVVSTTWLLAAVVLATIAVGLTAWPESAGPPATPRRPRPWQTPVRMALSGTLVAGLLGAARVLGAHLAGLLSTMPVILTALAPATHRADGPGAAAALVRGALASMPASVVFVAVLAYALVPLGPWAAFGLAVAALVLTDRAAVLASLRVPRRDPAPAPRA